MTEKQTEKQTDPKAATEATVKAVQEATDKAEEQGFFGKAVDETPRENYTVQGVVAGKPTPETDK